MHAKIVCIFYFLCYNPHMNYNDVINSDYFKETYAKIEELKKDFYVNHGFIHVNAVIENAKHLANVFCLDKKQTDLLLMASALHDVGYLMGREEHAKNGAKLALEFLTGKLPNSDVDLICNAIASHGGKENGDYVCPISMCLILDDKFDFSKQRYVDDGKEHKGLPLFKSIEKIELKKESPNKFKLCVFTTNKQLFENLEENYFFQKLFVVFEKLEEVCGHHIELCVMDWTE